MRSAITYLCTDDKVSRPLLAGWCEQRAAAESVQVTETVLDTDALLPPAERPGWKHVMALVAGGHVAMIVTLDRTMLVVGRKDWDRLAASVAAHGGVLVTHRTPAPSFPPTDGVQQQLSPVPAAPPTVELVANAARHSPPGTHHAALRLAPDGTALVMEAHDLSRAAPYVPAGARADEVREKGRGLLIVSGPGRELGMGADLRRQEGLDAAATDHTPCPRTRSTPSRARPTR
ncbi:MULTISPECIES: ATP-binding protein [Kitasatospora]|uniref:Uncharacterized protein n=1 Tax=Kitasatospora setae (strain ATCC 33774 / DSM 43861 / JCM 3304 / KCC A-0304 / NBRC 14216 / KM-6054) TaxID=452652 RepID=E4NG37_KITSK|nr:MULTISPECIES: ATP-binding protein [Kitasatospora]BAJ30467.1 hypothetical protein KSE_46860 [Kitasatospora setae KM-6054]